MVDANAVFKMCDVIPGRSINRNIQNVSAYLEKSTNPHAKSNEIIKKLGGTHCLDAHEASIIAKSMIMQAITSTLDKTEFDPVQAMTNAKLKVADLKEKHPYLFVMKTENSMTSATSTAKPTDNKKAKALEIFEANRGKKPSDIAKLIQVELGISFANAYYYVSRVFK